MELQSDLVLGQSLTGETRPVDRLLAFLDMLLCRSALVVKPDDPVRIHRQVGDDETDAGE